jgi:catechol 2,3-dioxygenase-like lactoylglutathione lyase family enzyme
MNKPQKKTPMSNLKATEIKAFIPAKNYLVSKQFYQDLGFTQASDTDGITYFHLGNVSFLLQDFYEEEHAENFMMHLLVEDVDAWFEHVKSENIRDKYQIHLTDITSEPWGMRDFCLTDPSDVLWRIGQNIK